MKILASVAKPGMYHTNWKIATVYEIPVGQPESGKTRIQFWANGKLKTKFYGKRCHIEVGYFRD